MSDMTDMLETSGRRARGGGGAARRASRTAVSLESARFITRNIPDFEVLNAEALEMIEANAETLLAEIGVNFTDNPAALDLWRAAGADVQGERVRLPRGLARQLCATAPATFTQHARNPERNVEIGGRNLVLAPVYGPPFVRDAAGGRRYATIADFRNFVRLGYMSKWLHHSGGTVCEPTDIAVNKRHLDMLQAHMVLSDKPYMGSVTEPVRAVDSVEMSKILFGADFVDQNTVMTSLVNINSPMTFDATMMGALEVYARANQASIISPFIVGGAMAPTTVAGTLTQVLAEVSGRCRLFPIDPPRCAGDLRGLCDVDRHEQRRADIWHTGSGADHLWRRPIGAAVEAALSLWRGVLRVQAARCTGGL
jgi:trimethylamine---corrinoid protein Co-methyltransferase